MHIVGLQIVVWQSVDLRIVVWQSVDICIGARHCGDLWIVARQSVDLRIVDWQNVDLRIVDWQSVWLEAKPDKAVSDRGMCTMKRRLDEIHNIQSENAPRVKSWKCNSGSNSSAFFCHCRQTITQLRKCNNFHTLPKIPVNFRPILLQKILLWNTDLCKRHTFVVFVIFSLPKRVCPLRTKWAWLLFFQPYERIISELQLILANVFRRVIRRTQKTVGPFCLGLHWEISHTAGCRSLFSENALS
jgi:hypothetical protein